MTDQVASTQLHFNLANHQFVAGNELRKEKLQDPNVNRQQHDQATHYGLYVQDVWEMTDALKLGLGARGDYHEKFGWEFSPKLSAAYSLNDQWSIKAGLGQAYKAPTLKQLSSEFESHSAMGGRGVIRGNPNLKPETNQAYELGLHYHHNNFESSLGWFRNNVDDLIETQRQATCHIARKICLDYVNIAKAEIQGLEWSAAYQFEPWLHFTANYTYLDAQNKTEKIPLADRAKHQINSTVTWDITDQLQAKLRQQYRSQQFQKIGMPNADSYTLWHLYANYQINPQWTLHTGIENLTNRKIGFDPEQLQTWSDAGRRYFVGVNMSF